MGWARVRRYLGADEARGGGRGGGLCRDGVALGGLDGQPRVALPVGRGRGRVKDDVVGVARQELVTQTLRDRLRVELDELLTV